ncbi:hypothetical protein [Ferroacidibacillus organovorans]|uniref:DUF4309 domain-containing protein n=1 Tax=Ferroacidibacillus organovorans TaxID=1765683 RepID=A0A853KB92_9BACL|nr:hypothetical protein [Ferroacidibacillus organovorans]KYP79240.1 hypothetical protein AYJ22_15245 [Ferroacidibacillus organovorans]OAG87764.1 hypothetical protein AYW79_14730 [Ferroacidibacillus organovorans]
MNRRMDRMTIAATVIAMTVFVSGCGTTNQGSAPSQTQSTTHPPQTTNHTTTPGNPSSFPASVAMVHFTITGSQLKSIQSAVKMIHGNPRTLGFGSGQKIYVPAALPKGQKFLSAYSGINSIFGTNVNLGFSGFNLDLSNKTPDIIKKVKTVTLSQGHTGTWYINKPGTGGTTYFLIYTIGKTNLIYYSNLKTLSFSQIEKTASQWIDLGSMH